VTRRCWSSVALIASGLLLVGCTGSARHGAAPVPSVTVTVTATATRMPAAVVSRTQTVVFSPFDSNGSLVPGLHVTSTNTGHCQPSNVLDRTDTYRCFLDHNEPNGGNIADPCFDQGTYLGCLTSPFTKAVLRLNPDAEPSPTPTNTGQPTSGNAWWLQLTNGQSCGFLQGASDALDRMRLNYACTNGAVLYGGLDRSHPLWTIFYRTKNAAALTKVEVARAWF
jgi:hypothetical protein